jgi:hypothetical protein
MQGHSTPVTTHWAKEVVEVKKLLLITIIVAALALTLVPLAAAGASGHGGWKHGKAKFELVGKVTAVDADAGTVTIKVKAGTRTVRAYRGKEATMGFTATAKIWLLTDPEATAIAVGDVPVGAKVKARGVVDRADPAKPVFTIKNLKVHPLPVEEPVQTP